MHFTEKVLETLRSQLVDVSGNGATYKGVITAQQLVEVARLIPKEELEEMVNDIPPIKDFVELAKREPSTLFLVNVLMDECVIVEAVLIPIDRAKELVRPLVKKLEKQLLQPDEILPVVEVEREGKKMFVQPPFIGKMFSWPTMAENAGNEEEYEYEEEILDKVEYGCDELPVVWDDILTLEKEVRLTCEEYESLVAKGKAYIMLWWD
ncbi:hypothetical protein N186_04105 [Thermofilum adornatum]|uniref:Uncharacterized protein n=1 Tax=Thermofilum adornatum TaxID=1365176 RepID=S5Z770_9CREN|nr:hypothetical protein N186_04105 [Thermofilum adornatum]